MNVYEYLCVSVPVGFILFVCFLKKREERDRQTEKEIRWGSRKICRNGKNDKNILYNFL